MNNTLNYTDYYRPKLLLNITKFLLNNIIYIFIFFLSFTLYIAFWTLGGDYQQGEYYRIIYIHVSSAWNTFFIYYCCAIFSFLYLITKNNIFMYITNKNMEIGTIFSIVTLITGSIWGKPTWGTWWVWDARLTSAFLLFILYLIYVILSNVYINPSAYSALSIYCIIGTVLIPIIKKSVEWWNTLHQMSSITQTNNHIDLMILIPLLSMWLTLIIAIVIYNIYNIRTDLILNKMSRYSYTQ